MDVKAFQIHKKASVNFKNIQDKYNVNFKTNTIALADGTTQSFKSNLFAQFLTENISNENSFNFENLNKSILKSIQQFNDLNFEFSLNPAIAILERAKNSNGSTSTLLAVNIADNKLNFISIGDCNAFLIDNNEIKSSFPFSNKNDLDSNNSFINTKSFKRIESLKIHNSTIDLYPNYVLVICSDAISRYLFEFPDQISKILSFNNHQEFLEFCEINWQNSKMEQDDISLLIIKNGNNILQEFLPDSNFNFEESKDYPEFKISQPDPPNKLTLMEYNELNNKIKQLENEVKFINNKFKNAERLLIILIALIIIGLSLPYVINTNKQLLTSSENQTTHLSIVKDSQFSRDTSHKKEVIKEKIMKNASSKKNKNKASKLDKKLNTHDK